MQNIIGIAAILAVSSFAAFWPLGAAYAVFANVVATLMGAWAWNSKGLALRSFFILLSAALGFIGVFSVCLAMNPDAGTLVFGSDSLYLNLELKSHGSGQAQFGFYILYSAFVPCILGAILARGVNKRVSKRDAIPGTPTIIRL